MQVVTRNVVIDGEHYVLVKGEHDGKPYYGTIRRDFITNVRLNHALTGWEMAVAETPALALKARQGRIKLERYIAEGHTKAEIIRFIAEN